MMERKAIYMHDPDFFEKAHDIGDYSYMNHVVISDIEGDSKFRVDCEFNCYKKETTCLKHFMAQVDNCNEIPIEYKDEIHGWIEGALFEITLDPTISATSCLYDPEIVCWSDLQAMGIACAMEWFDDDHCYIWFAINRSRVFPNTTDNTTDNTTEKGIICLSLSKVSSILYMWVSMIKTRKGKRSRRKRHKLW